MICLMGPGTSDYATQNNRGNNDEIHIVVYDTEGDLSGFSVDANGNRTNAVLETFGNLSVNSNAKSPQGDSIYYPDVIFKSSHLFTGWITILVVQTLVRTLVVQLVLLSKRNRWFFN